MKTYRDIYINEQYRDSYKYKPGDKAWFIDVDSDPMLKNVEILAQLYDIENDYKCYRVKIGGNFTMLYEKDLYFDEQDAAKVVRMIALSIGHNE
jgi:hypothetical protein